MATLPVDVRSPETHDQHPTARSLRTVLAGAALAGALVLLATLVGSDPLFALAGSIAEGQQLDLEVVSVDVEASTLTARGPTGEDDRVLRVDPRAISQLAELVAGDWVRVTCANESTDGVGVGVVPSNDCRVVAVKKLDARAH